MRPLNLIENKTMKPDLNQILCKDRHFLKTAFRQPEIHISL
ncbi:hypothetical protein [Alysiella crassa]|nr:hypothetical protein [Alysiella crassa]